MRSSQAELAFAIPQRGTGMSMDVNWPLLCQSRAGQQDTSGWKEWEGDTRKPWKWWQLQGHMKKKITHGFLLFLTFPSLFIFPSDLFWLGCSLRRQARSLCMAKTSGLTRRWSGRTWGCACSTMCSSTTSPPRSTCCSMATSKSLTAANTSSTKKWRGIKVAGWEKGQRAVKIVGWWCLCPCKAQNHRF